jgi:hypothetical protein
VARTQPFELPPLLPPDDAVIQPPPVLEAVSQPLLVDVPPVVELFVAQA